jgi:hypothetical protein
LSIGKARGKKQAQEDKVFDGLDFGLKVRLIWIQLHCLLGLALGIPVGLFPHLP